MANNNATLVFAAPGALDTAVVGSDQATGVTVFNFLAPTRVISAIHETDPAATISYDFGIRRGTNITVIAKTPDMLRANRPTQGTTPNFPSRPILPGQFQFVILQRAGALTATNINILTDRAVF